MIAIVRSSIDSCCGVDFGVLGARYAGQHSKLHTPNSEDGTDVSTGTTTNPGSQSDILATR
jgi:hypothetical protein